MYSPVSGVRSCSVITALHCTAWSVLFSVGMSLSSGCYWPQGSVKPGNTIVGSLTYIKASNSYDMFVGCVETGFSVTSNIKVEVSDGVAPVPCQPAS